MMSLQCAAQILRIISCYAGNGGCTLIKRDLARQLGLVDEAGWPTQAGTRTTTVHGVVAGASERIPLMNLTYELRGMPSVLA